MQLEGENVIYGVNREEGEGSSKCFLLLWADKKLIMLSVFISNFSFLPQC